MEIANFSSPHRLEVSLALAALTRSKSPNPADIQLVRNCSFDHIFVRSIKIVSREMEDCRAAEIVGTYFGLRSLPGFVIVRSSTEERGGGEKHLINFFQFFSSRENHERRKGIFLIVRKSKVNFSFLPLYSCFSPRHHHVPRATRQSSARYSGALVYEYFFGPHRHNSSNSCTLFASFF